MTTTAEKKQRRNTSFQNPYVGKSGHLAVMAELAWRGYNVALPGIDIGDDIFVVNDKTGQLWRVQVKTASPQDKNGSRQYQVAVLDSQIRQSQSLHFVFALRCDGCWRFVVISRSDLLNYIENQRTLGSLNADGRRTFTITLNKGENGTERCAGVWQSHMENWSEWQRLDHNRSPDFAVAGPEYQ